MSNQGWAKLINAPFTRMKLNLCPYCTHFERAEARDQRNNDAYDKCTFKRTLISTAHTDKGRCDDYESSGETRLTETEIAGEMESVRQHREFRARNKPWWESIRDTADKAGGAS